MRFGHLLFSKLAGAFLLGLLIPAPGVHAQLRVDLEFNKSLYVLYEPIIAKVTIENLTGRDILLFDDDGRRWFTFEMSSRGGTAIPPYETMGELSPLIVKQGETATRRINITPLYPVREYGMYRVRANIYFSALEQYFSSPYRNFDVSDGQVIWSQEVGVPEPENTQDRRRLYTLLRHETGTSMFLYARIANPDNAMVYGTYPLGRLLVGQRPQTVLDSRNVLHVFHQSAPRLFVHSEVGLNGQLLSRTRYLETNTRPAIRRSRDGAVFIRGGVADVPAEALTTPEGAEIAEGEEGPAKLSDRPMNLPFQ